jgi:regulatory protein YycH of two-component signal transduction system YycFG
MELKYEHIKSIILGILIVTSLILTWNFWTYQPSYDELPETKVVQEVSLSSEPEKSVKEIVRPSQVVFHLNNEYYGTKDDSEIETVMDEMRGWTLGDFEVEDNLFSFIDRNNMVEIYYPDSISINTFKKIIPITDKDVENLYFDQIFIDMNVHGKENGTIYFVSQKDGPIYKSPVPVSFITDFERKYSGEAMSEYTKYVPYRLASEKPIYLPEDETELSSYKHLIKPIASDDFKNALFHDPSLVQNSYISTENEFTDGQSIMREYVDEGMIHYDNLAVAGNIHNDHGDILQRGIDFVNAHGGFTGRYRFADIDPVQKEVLFRLYNTDGYPIFGQNASISEIRLVLGETDIKHYKRNNFNLGLSMEDNKVKLMSGPEVVNTLITKGYDVERIENIVIGYEMAKDSQSLLINLEPRWYFLYEGEWRTLTPEGAGGEAYGLE